MADDVLGIDLSTLEIRQAREKTRRRRVSAQFPQWNALRIGELQAADLAFRTGVDPVMFHVLGDRERDRFVAGLGEVVPSGGLYCVFGDARRAESEIYGLIPAEVRRPFPAAGWEVIFATRTVFERRWSSSPAYFVGVRRRR